MKRFALLSVLALVVACGEQPTATDLASAPVQASFDLNDTGAATYILLVEDGVTEPQLAASVEAAGGTLEAFYPFSVAVATADGPDFGVSLAGLASAVQDVGFDISPSEGPELAFAEYGYPPNSGDDDFYFDLQWGPNYVGAQAAWEAGVKGQGVRVAVLDGGFDLDHPDLAPNLNLALSADMTGQGLQFNLPTYASHATHVSGIILAADNGYGIIGVAPEAELVAVKVLYDSGSGYWSDIIAGIYYAATVDADVINMSLGSYVPRSLYPRDITALAVAVGHAIMYARQEGTLVVTSAGNSAADLDGDGDMVRFMNGLPGTTGIAALTTLNWATLEGDAPLLPASYTNYGTSMVDFAAPGGSPDFYDPTGNDVCTIAGVTRYCYIFDYVLSAGNGGGWWWAYGTSMAAPHAAGVAALIISANGGDMHPAHVEREMRRAAVKMARGKSDFFGFGLVNSGY